MQRIILHLDFDSFFASVEQLCNPLLRGKPVGITAANGSTAIIAASWEAKKRGVTSPSRSYDAKKLCPDIVLVKADFEKYFEVSKQFLNICKDYSPFVELFSIDELFMDVTQTAHLFGGVDSVIAKIQKRITQEIGDYISISVGISYNKLLAKLGSGLDKPNGMTYITKENLDQVYTRAKLTSVCGIGPKITLRLHVIGIHTLLQLRKASLGLLIKEFGNVEGHFLYNVGFGRDDTKVIPYTEAPDVKSVGRQYCMAKNEYDWRVTMQHVYELCEEVGIKLRRLNKKARAVGFSLRGSVHIHEVKTQKRIFDTGDEMFAVFESFINKVGPSPRYVLENQYIRKISVWAADLVDAKYVSLSFFPQDQRKENLVKTIDAINDRFGDHTIRNGFLLKAPKLKTVPNGWAADRYDRMELARNA